MEERLQKWIARCGISSRRAAEELLRQGRVTLNGRVAGLGESGELLAELAGTGEWLEGERFRSSADEADVQEWIRCI